MAKSDFPFSKIELTKTKKKPTKPTFLKDTKINGFDTETADGKIFLLTYCDSGSNPKAIHNDFKPLTSAQIFGAITRGNARGALNVWYNLDYDATVILANLPLENLYEISLFNFTVWEGYQITYIPSKLLTIKSPNKHTYKHFDVSQFFFGSLEAASNSWLGRSKLKDTLDLTRFGMQGREVNQYVKENWEQILIYGKEDAALTRDLWERFSEEAEALEIPCGKPYSTGYLAEQTYNVYFQTGGKPRWAYGPMQELAWAAYHGGRFEVIKRGTIESIVTVDINSAYPNVLRNLPDPGSLKWFRFREEVNYSYYNYGFIRAKVTTDSKKPIQPYAIKHKSNLKFPILNSQEMTLTLQEFKYAKRVGLISDYEVIDSWLAKTLPYTKYPFRWIEELYQKRQEYKRAGEDKKQLVLKIILNSLYGKLAQLTDKTVEHTGNDTWQDTWIYYPMEVLPKDVFSFLVMDAREIHKEIEAGRYFNPFLASYITAETRLQLLRGIYDSNLEDHTVMLATDSIMVESDAFNQSDFMQRFGGVGLGAWEKETEGRAFVVGSGIYEVEKEDGSLHLRTRGFSPSVGAWTLGLDGMSIREASMDSERDKRGRDVIRFTHKRPLKIGQAIWQRIQPNYIGVFSEYPKGIVAGMDSKRNWPKGSQVSFQELREGKEDSKPLTLSEDCLS